MQYLYGLTGADASLPVGIYALNNNSFLALVLTLLQEIWSCCSRWNDPFRIRHCSEELWFSCVPVFEDHNGGDVATTIAVVRCRPHSDQLLVKHVLVAFMDKLMCPADQLQVVDVNKLTFFGRGTEKTKQRDNNTH